MSYSASVKPPHGAVDLGRESRRHSLQEEPSFTDLKLQIASTAITHIMGKNIRDRSDAHQVYGPPESRDDSNTPEVTMEDLQNVRADLKAEVQAQMAAQTENILAQMRSLLLKDPSVETNASTHPSTAPGFSIGLTSSPPSSPSSMAPGLTPTFPQVVTVAHPSTTSPLTLPSQSTSGIFGTSAPPPATQPTESFPIPRVPAQRMDSSINKTFRLADMERLPDTADFRQFRHWRENWNSTSRAQNFASFPHEQQIWSFLSALGAHGKRILEYSYKIDFESPDITVSGLLTSLHDYFREKNSKVVAEVNFIKRKQQQGESFDKYWFCLKDMAEEAEICNHCRDAQIVRQIVVGIRDHDTRVALEEETTFPTLDRAIAICRAKESANKSSSKLTNAEIQQVQHPPQVRPRARSTSRFQPAAHTKTCGNCGKTHTSGERACPAKGRTCTACNKKGHYAVMCRSSRVSSVYVPDINKLSSCSEESKFCELRAITAQFFSMTGTSLGYLKHVLPDSGASANLISVYNAQLLGIDVNKCIKPEGQLTAANSLSINIIGEMKVQIKYNDFMTPVTFQISDEYQGTLLSLETCIALKIIHVDFPNPIPQIRDPQINSVLYVNRDSFESPPTTTSPRLTRSYQIALTSGTGNVSPYISPTHVTKESLLKEYSDVFEGEKHLKVMDGPPMVIHLKPNATPFKVRGPRPIPLPLRERVKKMLDDLESRGIIQKVSKPTEWVHPMSVVQKGDKLRLTVDLRKLNEHVRRPEHPITSPKNAIANIPPNASIFTTFDATSGYHQVPLHRDSQDITTFITPWGRYKHLRATMGLSCAGDEYNRRGDEALADMKTWRKWLTTSYYTTTPYNITNKTGITLNPTKFHYAQPEVKFAGFRVTKHGIQADPQKVKAISQFPIPKNISELRFSDAISARFVPLRPLLSSKNPFLWTNDHSKAFQEVKDSLVSPPILTTFNPKRKTMVQTDASRLNGLGYILLQEDEQGTWKLIECGSRFITEAEERYAIVELELLAAVWRSASVIFIFFGLSEFTLVTDHQPLLTILNKKTLDSIENTRIQRLKSHLTPYNFITVWKKGSSSGSAAGPNPSGLHSAPQSLQL
ncbi:Uncharacterized protein FKW44_003459 [Caligus rogercresseyi]|uniref:Reverse transcriptase/retrotransposon-derived protein RNase H-like domain-containing protein n=1 Tax=Caligus rogercresseyi TaxID=217165 RepID=A0A7T8KLM2_CALRO|nr:Uncharacterized protein FKW44_003459 [Caligus rogercresseyi]